MKTTDEQLGQKLFEIHKKIRTHSDQTLDGYKPRPIVENYYLQIESEIIQKQISWRNKKKIIKELDEAGVPKISFEKRIAMFKRTETELPKQK